MSVFLLSMYVLMVMYVYVCTSSRVFFSSRIRHTSCALVTGVQTCALPIYQGFLILSVSVEANLYLNGRYWLPFYVALVLAATPLAARLRRSHGVQHHIATAAAVLALLLVGAHSLRTVHLTGENRHGRGYAEMAWRYSPTVAAVRKLPPNAIIF